MMRRLFGLIILLVIPVLPVSAQLWPRVIVHINGSDTTYATRLGGKTTAETEVLLEDFEGYKNIYNLNNRANGIRWLNVTIDDNIAKVSVISGARSLRFKAGKALSTCDIPGLRAIAFNIKSTAGVNSIKYYASSDPTNKLDITPSSQVQHILFPIADAVKNSLKITIGATSNKDSIYLDDVQFTVQKREYLYCQRSSASDYTPSSVTITYDGLTVAEKEGGTYNQLTSITTPAYITLPAAPVRSGQTFVGWLVSLDSGDQLYMKDGEIAPYPARLFHAGTLFLVSQSITFTAQYNNCDHCFPVRF